MNEEENGDLHLTLIFYNQAVPPLQLEVDKIDDDFTSPLAGVSFELTRLGRKSTDSDSVKRINSFDRILKTFNNDGISKLSDLAGDDLDSVINHFKAVKKADNRYKSLGGIKKNAKGSVKFVIETDPIEADEN